MYFKSLVEHLGYSDRDILVIVNIDDVGMHKDVTEASFKAFDFGMVKSGSIMVPCPNYNQAIKLWRENPEIGLGIHLTLNSEWREKHPWTPILPKSDVPSLYNPEGIMWPTDEELLLHANPKDIKRELEAQITKVIDTGLKPSHLDYHMRFHQHPDFLSIIIELSRKYMLPVRVPRRKKYRLPFIKNNLISLRRKGYIYPDTQMATYSSGAQNLSLDFWKAQYHDHLRSLKPGVHSINVHIAAQTKELQNITGNHDSTMRQMDFAVWTSNDTKMLAEALGIIFIDYRPLKALQETKLKII